MPVFLGKVLEVLDTQEPGRSVEAQLACTTVQCTLALAGSLLPFTKAIFSAIGELVVDLFGDVPFVNQPSLPGSWRDPRFNDLGVDAGCDQIPPMRLALPTVVHQPVLKGIVKKPKVQWLSGRLGVKGDILTDLFTHIRLQSELAPLGDFSHESLFFAFGRVEFSGIESSRQRS